MRKEQNGAAAFSLKQMPPEAARLCLDVEKFIRDELGFDPSGLELVLAFSGGADSRALFFILLALAPRLGFTLSLAHLDHGLRESSAAESSAASALAAGYGLACHAERIDVAGLSNSLKLGKEEAGRLARMRFFQTLRQRDVRRWLVTGHQLNDLAEDMLMRLVRGSGWPALGGMRALDERNRTLRPLLLTPRAAVEAFLAGLGENWIRDPMNEDQAYLRNRVRAAILPLFLKENPSFLETVADLWRLSRLDEAMLDHLLAPSLKRNTPASGPGIPCQTLASLPKALRLRLYKAKLEALGPGQPLLRNLLALDRAFEGRKTGAEIQFPGNKKAKVLRDEIRFSR